jgi:hypothetical protein
MHAARTACALMLSIAAGCLHAQEGDPLKSPACGAALAALQAARADQADAARTEHLRSEAATTCLGAAHAPRNTARALQAPTRVPPPQIDVPVASPRLPVVPSAPPPAVSIDRLPTPATCDPGGCWVNDGSHSRYVPPNLVGPHGLCTQQGGQVYCP